MELITQEDMVVQGMAIRVVDIHFNAVKSNSNEKAQST
jgi:hypothetical protein